MGRTLFILILALGFALSASCFWSKRKDTQRRLAKRYTPATLKPHGTFKGEPKRVKVRVYAGDRKSVV